MTAPSRRTVARAALIVMVGFMLSKVTGIIRQLAIARVFGTSAEMDAYFAAFNAPDLIFMLISGGALATAFIPVFADYLHLDERDEAWRMASNVLTVCFALSATVSLLLALAAPLVIHGIAPAFTPELKAITVTLMRIILFSTVIFSVSGLVTGVLHSLQHFLLPAFAPMLYNIGIIIGLLVIVPRMPPEQRVYGLAWGSVIGAAFHLAIQIPALLRHRVRYRPVFDLWDPGLRRVAILMAPRAAALGLIYFKFIFRSNFASRLADGSLSALEFAWDLMQLPETIFATAVALAVFPTLAELASQERRQELAETFNYAIRIILILTVPAAVGLLVLGTPLVRAFYERGAFDSESSRAVSYALGFFAFGIVGHGLLEIVARLFYAQKDTIRPLYAAAVMLVVTGLISWYTLGPLGIGGIALGDTVGVFVEVGLLMWWLRARLPEAQSRAVVVATAKVTASVVAMALALQFWLTVTRGLALPLAGFDVGIFVVAGGGILIGALVYGGVALLLGLEEIRTVPRLVLRRQPS